MLLYADSNGVVHFIFARLKILFLHKFGPKNQYCQFSDDVHFLTGNNFFKKIWPRNSEFFAHKEI